MCNHCVILVTLIPTMDLLKLEQHLTFTTENMVLNKDINMIKMTIDWFFTFCGIFGIMTCLRFLCQNYLKKSTFRRQSLFENVDVNILPS